MDDPEEYVWGEIRYNMEEFHCCFRCGFWMAKLEQDKSSKDLIPLIIEGHHYYVKKNPKVINYDGCILVLKINDDGTGTVVMGEHLTHQGEVPLEWRKHFRNNAFFITYEDYIQIDQLQSNTAKPAVDFVVPQELVKKLIKKYHYSK
jgi:hypothetical protein